jgi:hypothetical protein
LPNPEAVAAFYKQTRPWGFWKPDREKVMALDPTFVPNSHFKRDGFNLVVGVVWQMAQLLIPVYFMIRENGQMVLWSGVFLLCSWLLKKYWWNTLED